MNQEHIVLNLLKKRPKKGITQKDVLKHGIFRLAARCHDLKARGHQIETEILKDVNQHGHAVRFACYRLVES